MPRTFAHCASILFLTLLAFTTVRAEDATPLAALQAKGAKFKLNPAGAPLEANAGPTTMTTAEDYKLLGQLNTLVKVYLGGSKDVPLNDETVPALEKLDKVEIFFANGAEISDDGMKAFESLKSLKQLGFDHWGWKIAGKGTVGAGLSHLAALPNLQTVRFGGCRIDNKACEALAQVKSLQSIDLQHAFAVNDAGIAMLKTLPALRIIKLSPQYSPRITDATLASLGEVKTLEEIEINETCLSYEKGFANLKGLTALKKITLTNIVTTEDEIAKLKADHATTEVKWTKPDDVKAEKAKADLMKFQDAQTAKK